MTKEDLRNILNKPYSRDNWKEVVTFVFPNVSIRQVPADIPVKERNKDLVESFKQLGDVRLNDGKILALFELKLKANVNILRNRVRLNEIVSETIDQETAHGVLSIFEQGTEDYRFTFSAKETAYSEADSDFVQKKTDAKRYTYLLGKNESCKTPADRFFDLGSNKEKTDINAIQDAFSVEKLSKQFFKEYKEHYQKFVSYLINTDSYHKSIFKSDDKAIRDFVKLLLGRLVFIQFVQKKKWLGVPAATISWHEGDVNFLYNSFKSYPNKELFYSEFLEPLFYEALNKPGRPDDLFYVTGTKVPYLNGGLFEKGDGDTSIINFPANYFEGLLDFFDRYNFTIDENDPEEHEVGIDPEMLGSIFENLLEDNKDKGAFYTPKEIVHYMCQESLKEYLKTYLDEQNAKFSVTDVESFVRNKEVNGVAAIADLIATALRDVKICDPAIGSGAFPMGLLTEIYRCMYVLYQADPTTVGAVWGMKSWEPNTVKKNIIQKSIYGVDIEKGAVDIARLRFWLSLIIDEPEPHALPNLDYKIVVGNSLVSKLGDDIIDIDWTLNETSHGLFGADLAKQKSDLLKKISAEQKEFFNPDSDKKKLAGDIRKLKIDLMITQLELMISTKGIEKQPRGSGSTIAKQTKIYLQTSGWKNSIKDLQKLKIKPEAPLHFFDWKLDFPEVLNEIINSKPGFDIVIGNPPYIQLQKMGNETDILQEAGFETFVRTGDIYSLFYEKSIQLLKAKGTLTFITSNKWMRAKYGEILRAFFIKHNPLKLIDLGSGVFENATVDTNIILVSKQENKNNCLALDLTKIKNINDFKQFSDKWTEIKNLTQDSWVILSGAEDIIKQKIEKIGKPLKDWDINIYRGVLTGFNEAFIINTATKEKLCTEDPKSAEIIKPILRGKDIKKYKADWADLWLIATHNGYKEKDKRIPRIEIENYQAIKKHLDQFLPQLTNRGDKGETPYNLRNCAYMNDFEKEKIVWAEMTNENNFIWDSTKSLVNQTCYFIANSNEYILSVLNSKITKYYMSISASALGEGAFRWIKIYVEKIPIPEISETAQKPFISLVNQILEGKKQGRETIALEQEIDNLVYELYELTYDEVKVIDPNFELSEDDYSKLKLD